MFLFRTRFVAMLFASLALLGALAMPVAASAQGNSEAAHLCQDGGYLNFTDASGNGFKNTGECVSYAAQGYTLVPVVVTDLSISGGQGFNSAPDGVISGTGFTPNSTIVMITRVYSPSAVHSRSIYSFPIDGNGAFTTGPRYDFCFRHENTGVEITAPTLQA